jgi:hypothetical protein
LQFGQFAVAERSRLLHVAHPHGDLDVMSIKFAMY